jgi:hypothetical protein
MMISTRTEVGGEIFRGGGFNDVKFEDEDSLTKQSVKKFFPRTFKAPTHRAEIRVS